MCDLGQNCGCIRLKREDGMGSKAQVVGRRFLISRQISSSLRGAKDFSKTFSFELVKCTIIVL
jgi:hypothetical protein